MRTERLVVVVGLLWMWGVGCGGEGAAPSDDGEVNDQEVAAQDMSADMRDVDGGECAAARMGALYDVQAECFRFTDTKPYPCVSWPQAHGNLLTAFIDEDGQCWVMANTGHPEGYWTEASSLAATSPFAKLCASLAGWSPERWCE